MGEPAAVGRLAPGEGKVRAALVAPLPTDREGRPRDCWVGKLCLPPGERYFGCRHCHGLTYASRKESRRKANARHEASAPPRSARPCSRPAQRAANDPAVQGLLAELVAHLARIMHALGQ
jgi:hypothetical protein